MKTVCLFLGVLTRSNSLVYSYNKCPFPTYEHLGLSNFTTTPKYKVREDKYIAGILANGPTNQFFGFREMVFLSIYLNRTLVLPTFMRHKTDDSHKLHMFQNALERIDFVKLNSLVKTVRFEDINQVCPEGMDYAYVAREELIEKNYDAFVHYNDTLNHFFIDNPIRHKDQGGGKFKDIVDIKKVYYSTDHTHIHLDDRELLKEFGQVIKDDSKCLLYVTPFMTLDWGGKIKRKFKLNDRYAVLAKEMVRATQRSEHVRKVAKDFIVDFLGKDYHFLHWRYDPEDFGWFGNHCKKYSTKFCRFKNGFDPKEVGKIMNLWIQDYDIKKLYIATPSRRVAFFEEVAKYLPKDFLVFKGSDLRKYIKNIFLNCQEHVYDSQIHDFTSQVEQELGLWSKCFWGSIGSSWTMAIGVERKAWGIDSSRDSTNKFFLEKYENDERLTF